MDDNPTIIAFKELKDAHDTFRKTLNEAQAENDKRLEALEKGKPAAELEEKVNKMLESLGKFDDLNTKIQAAAKAHEEQQKQLEELNKKLARKYSAADPESEDRAHTKSQLEIVGRYLRDGKKALNEDEQKTLRTGNEREAGALVMPEYVRQIIKDVVEKTPFREHARVISIGTDYLTTTVRTGTHRARWTAENGKRTETKGIEYAEEKIPVHEMYSRWDISNNLLEDSIFNIEGELRMEFAEQFARTEGEVFIVGNGVNKPEGILFNNDVESTDSGNATKLTGDGLIDLIHDLKTEYTRNSVLLFNRRTLAEIRKLKDTAGQYVFQSGMLLINGVPNTVLGTPYFEAPDMPDVAAGARPIAYGDFMRAYLIVDRIMMQINRDPFSMMDSNVTRYIGRRRVGGQVVLPEAIRTLKVAA